METIGDCDKRIASNSLLYFDLDDCCMRDTMAYSASPASTGLLRHQLAYLLWPHYEVPPLKEVVICLVGGKTKWETACWRAESSSSSSVNFAALMAVANIWAVLLDLDTLPHEAVQSSILLDLDTLPHEAVQLSLSPGHLGHELALVCRNYLWGWWRYCICNKRVWWSYHIFLLGCLTSREFSIWKMRWWTPHIIHQNDPHYVVRNWTICRKICLRTLCEKLWSV